MSGISTSGQGPLDKRWLNPQAIAAAGMAVLVLPLLPVPFGETGRAVAAALLAVGAIAAGSAVALRPKSPIGLLVAALSAFVGSLGFEKIGWDSGRTLFVVLAVIASAAALLVWLPRPARLAAASALVLLHFGGILTAVTSAPPGTWLANEMWGRVYYPYLQFFYLNNAYHFYAPEPGPATLMWFCVEYERDASGEKNWRWVKVPDLDRQGVPRRPDGSRLWPYVEYTRRLSLAENASFPRDRTPGALFQLLLERRLVAGRNAGIPLHPDFPFDLQYRPINKLPEVWLSSYVRHVAAHYPCEKNPELAVTGVKVYRVVHSLLMPQQVVEGVRPYDESLYLPIFQGHFDAEGKPKVYEELSVSPDLRAGSVNGPPAGVGPTGPAAGAESPDPFLYWVVPILKPRVPPGLGEAKVTNYVYKHAGVEDRGELP